MTWVAFRLLAGVAIVVVIFFAAKLGDAAPPRIPPQPEPMSEGEWTIENPIESAEVEYLEQRNAQLSRQLARERRGFRRRLRTVIFSRAWGNHWLERAFLCIHTHEGAWGSNTNPTYDGGLQMDMTFQRTYGREFLRWFGPAYNWPVAVQIAVAIKAHQSGRGFGPWPNTRRPCGV